ncbi:hypothetical protein B0H16DRAFT_1477708 [Mycena metata]|uniref:Uncharacterized protein n=1 Tax=Mycena metata TaxID=1033252 RepID=A0AAD7MFL2_9AGAR|nr:hypothetical protein B0H16DRAFT_1477708 [Mycena metata]
MPTAYVMSFVAIVLSFVVHVHTTVSTTAPITFPCAAYQPSTEHGVTHSHPRFMAVGVLSLMFVVSAHALRRAVSASTSIHSAPERTGGAYLDDRKEHTSESAYTASASVWTTALFPPRDRSEAASRTRRPYQLPLVHTESAQIAAIPEDDDVARHEATSRSPDALFLVHRPSTGSMGLRDECARTYPKDGARRVVGSDARMMVTCTTVEGGGRRTWWVSTEVDGGDNGGHLCTWRQGSGGRRASMHEVTMRTDLHNREGQTGGVRDAGGDRERGRDVRVRGAGHKGEGCVWTMHREHDEARGRGWLELKAVTFALLPVPGAYDLKTTLEKNRSITRFGRKEERQEKTVGRKKSTICGPRAPREQNDRVRGEREGVHGTERRDGSDIARHDGGRRWREERMLTSTAVLVLEAGVDGECCRSERRALGEHRTMR